MIPYGKLPWIAHIFAQAVLFRQHPVSRDRRLLLRLSPSVGVG